MVAAASARSRPASAPAPLDEPRRSAGTYVLIGVPILLLLVLAWQLFGGVLHTGVAVRQATAVSQVSLQSDPAGTRVDFVVVDRVGQDTTLSGQLDLTVREPDGAQWRTSKKLDDGDFHLLPDASVMAGRTGYSVVIPASDWARPPRRGGLASINITLTPTSDTPAFSTQSQQPFP